MHKSTNNSISGKPDGLEENQQYTESFKERLKSAELSTREGLDLILRAIINAVRVPLEPGAEMREKVENNDDLSNSEKEAKRKKAWELSSAGAERIPHRIEEIDEILDLKKEEIISAREDMQREIEESLNKLWPEEIESKKSFYFKEVMKAVRDQYDLQGMEFMRRLTFENGGEEFPEQIIHLRILFDMKERLKQKEMERSGKELGDLKDKGDKDDADKWLENKIN